MGYQLPILPLAIDLESKAVLKQLNAANRNIVTTHDDLYRAASDMNSLAVSAAAKEVSSHVEALKHGFSLVSKTKLLTNSSIKKIQQVLEHNSAGFRRAPGTTLKNQ